jgi:PAS domain S-box-containing protein
MSFHSQALRLLIVEDNPGDYILIEDYLGEEVVRPAIVHATTFAQARESLSEPIAFDAILLDLSLPDNSGEALVNEIVQLAGPAPVIVLTGYANKGFSIRTLSLGVSDYLLKDELTASQLYKSIAYSMERKRIQLKLNESEENYRNLFHLSPLPMWVYDVETYRFLNVNEAAIKNYGYSREELLSMTIKDIRPPEDVPKLEEIVRTTISPGITYQGAIRHCNKKGEIRLVEIQSSAIEFEGKKARIILANDITERMNYLRAIEDKNQKLQEIAWIQSHVVRAPLARIMGLVEFIANQPATNPESAELLNYILTSANELDEVIRTIVMKTEQVENQ